MNQELELENQKHKFLNSSIKITDCFIRVSILLEYVNL